MALSNIIAEIEIEISRLERAKTILSGQDTVRKAGRPKKSELTMTSVMPMKRGMSPEGRARVAAAQRARWAKYKKALSRNSSN
jgi:hypothetical protein